MGQIGQNERQLELFCDENGQKKFFKKFIQKDNTMKVGSQVEAVCTGYSIAQNLRPPNTAILDLSGSSTPSSCQQSPKRTFSECSTRTSSPFDGRTVLNSPKSIRRIDNEQRPGKESGIVWSVQPGIEISDDHFNMTALAC